MLRLTSCELDADSQGAHKFSVNAVELDDCDVLVVIAAISIVEQLSDANPGGSQHRWFRIFPAGPKIVPGPSRRELGIQ